ncbi:MAG: hypothetical protein ACI89X_001120 [Planctomycetota bacterium]
MLSDGQKLMTICSSTNSRTVASIAVLVALLALTGCNFGNQFRGTDRGALMPSARVQWSPRQRDSRKDGQRVQYRSTFEAGVTRVKGDFDQEGLRPDYEATLGHAVFAPELTWGGVRLSPRIGPAYGEIEVAEMSARASESGVGAMVGVEASWQGWSWCEPYVRYTDTRSIDWRVGRFEVGVDLRASDEVGFQIAYARQTSEIDDATLFGIGDSARIETEGIHIGLSLRF